MYTVHTHKTILLDIVIRPNKSVAINYAQILLYFTHSSKRQIKGNQKKCNDLDLCDTRYDYAKNMLII